MQRSLFLMRHAKAEGFNAGGDRARELSARGRRDAQAAGQLLAGRGIQLVLCSSSVRTRQTCEALGLRDADGQPARVEYMDALYLSDPETIRQRISETTAEITALLVVAHSPGIPLLGAELAWANQPHEADRIQCWFPTAAFSEFVINGEWTSLMEPVHDARLREIHRPGADTRGTENHTVV